MRRKRILLAFLALSSAPAMAAPALPEFSALYDFERGRVTIGETRISLEHNQEDIYRYWSESKATGFVSLFVNDIIRQESLFRFEDGKFWPVSYEYQQLNSSKYRDESIVYDWTDGVAKVNYRGHESEAKLDPGTMDHFLMQFAITVHSRDGALDRVFHVLDNADIKTYHLKNVATETVVTPAGKFETLRVERIDDTRDKRLRLWLAPELGYLPVKIEHEKLNEETLRLVLKAVTNNE